MRKFHAPWVLAAWLCLHPVQAEEPQLEVTSNPPGALVVVDHLVRGRTPLTLSELPPGSHHLRVSHGTDYRPYQVELEIQDGQSEQCHVQLNPRTHTTLKKGVELFRQGQTKQAELHLQRAVTGTPLQPEAYIWLGRLEKRAGRKVEALELFRKAAQFYSDKPELHLEMAELHQELGNPSAALTSYKLAMLKSGEFEESKLATQDSTWEKIKAAGRPEQPLEQLQLAYMLEQKGIIPEALHWAQVAAAGTFGMYLQLVR